MSEHVAPGRAVVVSGPSGSGKTTLVKHLMLRYPRSHFSISATTRSPRGEEVDGVDYIYLSREEFLDLREHEGLLEWADVHGEHYGTPRSEAVPYLREGRHVFLDIDVQGGLQVQRALPDESYLLFVLPPDREVLESRLRGRGTDSDATVRLRLANTLDELAVLPRYDAVVVNDELGQAVDEAQRLLDSGEKNTGSWLDGGGRKLLRDGFGLEL